MSLGWREVAFFTMFWVLASLFCAVCEGSTLDSEHLTVVQRLMDSQVFTSDSLAGKIIGVFNPTMWGAFLDMITFNFGIFNQGAFQYFRWILLLGLTIGFLYGLAREALRLIRGVGGF